MKLEEVLELIKKNSLVLKRLGVRSLALFGSTVRNEATPTSDIDILVTFKSSPTFDQYMDTRIYLEDLLGCSVDLVIQEGLKPYVRDEIEKELVYVA